jgi:hypothetical protein
MDPKVEEAKAKATLEAFGTTLAISFASALFLFGLNFLKWGSEMQTLTRWHRDDAVNEFIVNCTKKPKDCKFLLDAVRNSEGAK